MNHFSARPNLCQLVSTATGGLRKHLERRDGRPHWRAFAWYSVSMVLTFRTAIYSEGEEVARVIRAAFTPYLRALGREFPADGSAEYAEERARFATELERGDIYVALDGERIVGAVRTKPQKKDLYIHTIAVDPPRQSTGVGSWLLQRIDEVARARGLGGLSLETAEMAAANIRLYQRHGFEIVRRGPPGHGLDPHTRVYMVKSFSGAHRRA